MPYNEESRIDSQWTKSIIHTAGRIFNNIFGLLPGCFTNDAKYSLPLGDLTYSQNELLRIASQGYDFNERAQLVTDYLAGCNPHLKKSLDRMNADTKKLFFTQLSDDPQFGWCLARYPEMEIDNEMLQPGVRGLNVADSVTRNKWRKTYLGSPLGGIILWLIAAQLGRRGNPPGNPPGSTPGSPSWKDLMDRAPALDPSRRPALDSAGLGLAGAGAHFFAYNSLLGVQKPHAEYTEQRAKEIGKKRARLLKDNIEQVISEHKHGIDLPRKGGGIIKCVNIESENSPTIENSEALRRIESGQTGCSSICGTQLKKSVEVCLNNSHAPTISEQDNIRCEDAGPYQSEASVRRDYFKRARLGVYTHEKQWRADQKLQFNGECKEPLESNFNPYGGGSIDKVIQEGNRLRFASDGRDWNKRCDLNTFPKIFPKRPLGEGLICEDNPYDQPYKAEIHTISQEDLKKILKELRDSLSRDIIKDCPKLSDEELNFYDF